MKFALLTCLLCWGLGLQAQYSMQQMQSLYTKQLQSIGIKSFVDSDGDVQFKYEGTSFYIDVMSGTHVRVVLFGFWEADSGREKYGMMAASSAVNSLHYVKAYVGDDDHKAYITVELLFPDVKKLGEVLEQVLEELDEAKDTFVGEMVDY